MTPTDDSAGFLHNHSNWDVWHLYDPNAPNYCNLLGRDVFCTFHDFKEALRLVELAIEGGERSDLAALWERLAAPKNEGWRADPFRLPGEMLDLTWPPRWDPDPEWPPDPQLTFEEFRDSAEPEQVLADSLHSSRRRALGLACALELAVYFRAGQHPDFVVIDARRLDDHLKHLSYFIRPAWTRRVGEAAIYSPASFGFDLYGFWQAMAWGQQDLARWERFLRAAGTEPGQEFADPVSVFCNALDRLIKDQCADWEHLADDVWWQLKDPRGREVILDPCSYWNNRDSDHPYFMVSVDVYDDDAESVFYDYANPYFLYPVTKTLNQLGIKTDVPYWEVTE
jgi:hypothetical protein